MSFHLELLSNTTKIYSGDCEELLVPSQNGVVQILPRHVDLLTIVISGLLTATLPEKKTIVLKTKAGVLHKSGNTVTVLLEDPLLLK